MSDTLCDISELLDRVGYLERDQQELRDQMDDVEREHSKIAFVLESILGQIGNSQELLAAILEGNEVVVERDADNQLSNIEIKIGSGNR